MRWEDLKWQVRRLRQHLSVSEQDGQLVIQRRWQPHALTITVYALIVVAGLWTPWATHEWQYFLHHHPHYMLFLRLFYALLLIAPIVSLRRLCLRSQTFVFNRARDFVTCNGHVVCALSEVQSVRVGKPLGWEGDTKGLGFLIHGRNEVTIEWDDLLGAGMENLGQAGLALSQYARVPLWAEGAWRDPNALDASPLLVRASPPPSRPRSVYRARSRVRMRRTPE